jgi:hypothetical protein
LFPLPILSPAGWSPFNTGPAWEGGLTSSVVQEMHDELVLLRVHGPPSALLIEGNIIFINLPGRAEWRSAAGQRLFRPRPLTPPHRGGAGGAGVRAWRFPAFLPSCRAGALGAAVRRAYHRIITLTGAWSYDPEPGRGEVRSTGVRAWSFQPNWLVGLEDPSKDPSKDLP